MEEGFTLRFMKNKTVVAVILFLAVLLPYMNTFDNAFVWDDITLIVNNENLHDRSKNLNFIRDFWWVDEINKGSPYFRPIIALEYIIDYNIWKLNPFGYHLTNLMVFYGLTFIVYLLITKLYNPAVGFFASVLFAVHPIHTENVTWIAGRTDVTMGLFYVLSLYLYVQFRNSHQKHFLWLSLVSGLCALLSKEVAVTLPVAILIYEWCFHDVSLNQIRRSWARYASYFALIPLFYLLRTIAFSGSSNFIFLDGLLVNSTSSFFNSVMKVLYSFANYLYLSFFPVILRIRWEIADFTGLFDLRVAFAVGITSLFILYCLHTYRQDRKKLFLPLFFLINILLVINIITVRDAFAERFVFLSSVAVCTFIPFFVRKLFAKRKYVFTVLFIVIMLFGIRTYVRNNDWHDYGSLVQKEIVVNPHSAEANFLYGSYLLYTKNDTVGAVEHLLRSVQIDDYRTDAHLHLGTLAWNGGHINEALAHFEKCKEYGPPEYVWKGALNAGTMLFSVGVTLEKQGRFEESQVYFSQAADNFLLLAEKKSYVGEFHRKLAVTWHKMGNFERAHFATEQALLYEPNDLLAQELKTILEKELGIVE